MNVTITGCGSIGARHARNAVALGHRVSLSDLDMPRAERLAVEIGCEVVSASGQWPDALMICTPASTHAAVARELRCSGWAGPTFVEKPLALSSEECDIFRHWPHQTTMVGYNWRFHPSVLQLRKKTAPRRIEAMYFTTDTSIKDWPGATYGDAVSECSHDIDLMLWWTPGYVPTLDNARIDAEEAYLGFGIGAVWTHWNSRPFREIRIECEDGEWERRLAPTDKRRQEWLNQSYVAELAHFLDCAKRGVPTDVPFTDGIRVLDVIAQAKEMAACPRS